MSDTEAVTEEPERNGRDDASRSRTARPHGATTEPEHQESNDAPRSRTARPQGARRRRSKQRLTIIYWRDIPAQVTAARGQQKEKALLTQRFQDAIDRSAGVAGLTAAHDYVGEWRKVDRPFEGDVRVAADREAARLETEYRPSRLHALVRQGGLELSENPTEPGPIETQQEATS